ncbi:MAG: hypothetical protein PF481_02040 [Bacteroidales bacterium]|nr:hypothetical protein [Bacteroidales bacterium]
MLEYGFQILPKLSFDRELFHKELRKIIAYLTPDEIKKLERWLRKYYYNEYIKSNLFV